MNWTQIIIILVALLIIIMLSFLIFFIVIKNRTNNKKTKLEKLIKGIFENISLEIVEIQFNRIDIIARNNPKYKDKCSIFENKLDNIYKKEKILKNDSQEFLATINSLDKKEILLFIDEFKKNASILQDIIKKFIDQANLTLKAENFLRKEMNFYRERYKIIINYYQQIIYKIEYITSGLVQLNNEIIELNIMFNKQIKAGEVEKCATISSQYKDKVLLLAKILNNAPIIGDIIYNQIPHAIDKIVKHFNNSKNNIQSNLNYINFLGTLSQIRDCYIILKNDYKRLDIEKSKIQIIWIFKNIKSLEYSINNEILSQKIVLENFKFFMKKTEEVLRNYVTIKKQMKILINSNKVSKNDVNLLGKMDSVAKEIDNNAMFLRNNLDNKIMPFTSKKLKMKSTFELEISLIKIMNDLLIQIAHTKNFKLNFSNRYKYISAIITHLFAEINYMDIKLTNHEKTYLEELDIKINSIEKVTYAKQIDYNLINLEFLDIQNRIIHINKIIGGKKEAAIMTKNLLDYFAPKRKYSNNFNQKVYLAERQFLMGEYIKSLNTIISGIEMVK